MPKRKVTVKMAQDEAIVVAPMMFWQGLGDHFKASAEEFPEQAKGWMEALDHISYWVEKTKDNGKVREF